MNAYSQGLGEKIVQAVFERGMGKSEAAHAFGVRNRLKSLVSEPNA